MDKWGECRSLRGMDFLFPWDYISLGLVQTKCFFFFQDFIDLFLEKGARKEKERERNIDVWLLLMHLPLGTWLATQACALTGNQTGDPLVRRSALSPLSHTCQGPSAFFKITNQLINFPSFHGLLIGPPPS